MDLHTKLWRTPEMGSKKAIFQFKKISLKDNWSFKTKIMTIYCGAYNIARSKIYDNDNRKYKGKWNVLLWSSYSIREVV